MHGFLDGTNGMQLMASDTPNSMEYSVGTNFSVSLSGDNEAELARLLGEVVGRRCDRDAAGDGRGAIRSACSRINSACIGW